MRILVTGGAGFIGSAVVRHAVLKAGHDVLNVDKLTYAASTDSLIPVAGRPNYAFSQTDICDRAAIARLFADFKPEAVMHLAAESHVDRSIEAPEDFIETNVVGTARMLDVARHYWNGLDAAGKAGFRFHHISTDEVFGALEFDDPPFCETTPYDPRSPYSASKASSDHFVRAWHHTYGLPVVITNCTNNYGPYHFPEKLIPLIILKALHGEPLPVYGKGDNIRDWLFVEDHAEALLEVVTRGRVGETYAIGGNAERRNLDVVEVVCDLVDELAPALAGGKPRRSLIGFVADRPGHDLRYAMDTSRIKAELGWQPSRSFEQGIRETVAWFLANEAWWRPLRARYAGQRLGKAG